MFALGVLGGGYEFYDFFNADLIKMNNEIESKRNALNQSKTELAKLKNFSAGLVDIKARLKKTNSEFEEALEFIPRTLDLSKLLAKLNVLARNSGVDIDAFKPIKDENKKSESSEKSFYQTVAVELQLRGGFAQTVMFFDQISRLKRILNVESLKMVSKSGEENRGPASVVTPLETAVLLKTYRFSE